MSEFQQFNFCNGKSNKNLRSHSWDDVILEKFFMQPHGFPNINLITILMHIWITHSICSLERTYLWCSFRKLSPFFFMIGSEYCLIRNKRCQWTKFFAKTFRRTFIFNKHLQIWIGIMRISCELWIIFRISSVLMNNSIFM